MNTWRNVGGLLSPVLTPVMAETLGWPIAITIACAVVALVWFLLAFGEKPTKGTWAPPERLASSDAPNYTEKDPSLPTTIPGVAAHALPCD